MKIELQPWTTPNFITGKMPVGQRQDGFNQDAAPKWHVRDVGAETLAEQCDRFRAEIFAKAGKSDPANVKEHAPSPAGAHSKTGVDVQTTQVSADKAAGGGCRGSSCSPLSCFC